jgi:hypothetical protein
LYDRLRQRPSSPFMLFGCSYISVASLITRSMYPDLVDRILVSLSWMRWPGADAVFGHGRLTWMLQTNVPVMLLDSGFDGTASLPSVHVATFAGCAVQISCLESQVALQRPKEASGLPQWESHRGRTCVALPGMQSRHSIMSRVSHAEVTEQISVEDVSCLALFSTINPRSVYRELTVCRSSQCAWKALRKQCRRV